MPGGLPVITAGRRRKQTSYQVSEPSQPVWTERQQSDAKSDPNEPEQNLSVKTR